MKRVQSACIFQTLIFAQKEDAGYTREQMVSLNREEIARYRAAMDRAHTRYQITEETELPDGSIRLCIRKQYNDRADVSEYFNH